MNILLINHYAGSPEMGMEYRPYYLAKQWIDLGHKVTIVLANNSHIRHYNPEQNSEIKEEIIDGINYVWIRTPKYSQNGLARLKNIFVFVKTIYKNAHFFANKFQPDVVIASSTYPSDNYVARKIAKLSKAKHIYEVHDLWPLSPMELGGMSKLNPFIMLMQHAENFAYRNADAVVSMLPKTQEHMKAHGLDLKKWHYLPNGVMLDEWENMEPLNDELITKIKDLKTKYNHLIAYTGTFGVANALDCFVMSAKDNLNVGFVLVGKGPEKEHLIMLKENNNLNNVYFFESINKKQIPSLLTFFDFLYIGLQFQPLFRFGISPNKLIDYMMSGKPIIQGIKAGNNIVKEANCGLDIEPENIGEITKAIKTLQSKSSEELIEIGENGKNFVIKNNDYKVIAKLFADIF